MKKVLIYITLFMMAVSLLYAIDTHNVHITTGLLALIGVYYGFGMLLLVQLWFDRMGKLQPLTTRNLIELPAKLGAILYLAAIWPAWHKEAGLTW